MQLEQSYKSKHLILLEKVKDLSTLYLMYLAPSERLRRKMQDFKRERRRNILYILFEKIHFCCYCCLSQFPRKMSSSWYDQTWVVIIKVVAVQELHLNRMFTRLDNGIAVPERRTSPTGLERPPRYLYYFLCASRDYFNRRVLHMSSSSPKIVFWKTKVHSASILSSQDTI